MSFFNSFEVERLSYTETLNATEVNIDEINEGISQDANFLFYRSNGHIKIFDRVCDHNGGRLSLRGEKASCPLHGWEFDLKLQSYTNANCRKEPLLEVNEYELDSPYLNIPTNYRTLVSSKFDLQKKTKIRFLNHACLLFTIDDEFSFATDPWVIGSAFCNGWWLAKNSPNDVFQQLNKCDFIYISHNHPDHLHKASLDYFR